MHLPNISVCKTNLLRGLKKKAFVFYFISASISQLTVFIDLFFFILVFQSFTDPGLHKIRHCSLVCRCGFAFISSDPLKSLFEKFASVVTIYNTPSLTACCVSSGNSIYT